MLTPGSRSSFRRAAAHRSLADKAERTGGRVARSAVAVAAVAGAIALPVAAAGPAGADQARARQQWVLAALDVSAAWRITQGQGVVVAVIDSGVDPSVSDLTGSVRPGPDYTGVHTPISNPNWGAHGTWMASLIAGHGHGKGAKDGILGVAPRSRILSIRVITDRSDPGWPKYQAEPTSHGQYELARAIRYAVSKGAGVISMSLGYDASSLAVRAALQFALIHNVVVVASSGNSGTSQSGQGPSAPYSFPADYPGVIGVAAVTQSGQPAYFSSENLSVQVAAPGVSVPAQGRGSKYWLVSGTSPACALTAGVAALIKSRYPHLTAAQVRSAITRSSTHKPNGGYDDHVGFGTVDAAAALRTAAYLAKQVPSGVTRKGKAAAAGNFGNGEAGVPPFPVPSRGKQKLYVFLALAAVSILLILGSLWRLISRAGRRKSAGPPLSPGPSVMQAPVGSPGTASDATDVRYPTQIYPAQPYRQGRPDQGYLGQPGHGYPVQGYLGQPGPGQPGPGYGQPGPGQPGPGYGQPGPGQPGPGYSSPTGYGYPGTGQPAPPGQFYAPGHVEPVPGYPEHGFVAEQSPDYSGQASYGPGYAAVPGQAYRGQLPPAQVQPGQPQPDQLQAGQVHPGPGFAAEPNPDGPAAAYYRSQTYQAQGGPGYPGQAYSGQAYSGQAYSGQAYSGQAYSGQAYSGQGYVGQSLPGLGQPDAVLPPQAYQAPGGPDQAGPGYPVQPNWPVQDALGQQATRQAQVPLAPPQPVDQDADEWWFEQDELADVSPGRTIRPEPDVSRGLPDPLTGQTPAEAGQPGSAFEDRIDHGAGRPGHEQATRQLASPAVPAVQSEQQAQPEQRAQPEQSAQAEQQVKAEQPAQPEQRAQPLAELPALAESPAQHQPEPAPQTGTAQLPQPSQPPQPEPHARPGPPQERRSWAFEPPAGSSAITNRVSRPADLPTRPGAGLPADQSAQASASKPADEAAPVMRSVWEPVVRASDKPAGDTPGDWPDGQAGWPAQPPVTQAAAWQARLSQQPATIRRDDPPEQGPATTAADQPVEPRPGPAPGFQSDPGPLPRRQPLSDRLPPADRQSPWDRQPLSDHQAQSHQQSSADRQPLPRREPPTRGEPLPRRRPQSHLAAPLRRQWQPQPGRQQQSASSQQLPSVWDAARRPAAADRAAAPEGSDQPDEKT